MTKNSLQTVVLTGLWIGSACADPALVVRDAWIPEAPPAAAVQAGYMELVNLGASPLVVVGGRSPDFAHVEIHRTVQSGGGARMEAQGALRIEPGATLTLAPGGLHLMLIEPTRRLVAGDTVDVELQLEEGDPARASAEVRAAVPVPASHDHRHHH
jgi:hypothetical protein